MEAVDEIKARLSVEEVVGEVVALKRAGSAYKGLCPFHQEKTPSFYVTPGKGSYKCFGCGAAGDIFTFVMATRNMDFPDALRLLGARAGVEVQDTRQLRAAGTLEARIYEMNADAATYFQAMLATGAGARARDYLQRRRITAQTVERFGLGYAPDTRDGLCARLRDAGYGDDDLVAAGLAIAAEEGGPLRDRFRGRLIFPIRDAKGRILGFGGRVLGDGEPKYLNSPATAVFEKSRVLYTVEHAADAIRGAREAVVVEGYVDALRAHQEGFPNVVASLGTAITDYQLRALARLAPRLVLALDADPAGQKAAVRAGLASLYALSQSGAARPSGSDAARLTATPGGTRPEAVQVYVATLPAGQDPDDVIAADAALWRRTIADAVPLMAHYFALVEAGLDRTQPQWRQEAIDTLVPAIGQLGGLGLQQTYIERLSALTGVDARYLRDLTPGGAGRAAPRQADARRRGAPPAPAPASADPVRVTEEYLAGLLLLHRPLAPEVRAELAAHAPLTADLAPLFGALQQGLEPGAAEEDLADALAAAAAQRPPVEASRLPGEVRVCLARINEQRLRRELVTLGQVLTEVDRDTAREMDGRAFETMTLKEQVTLRFHKEQAQHRRQPAGTPGDAADGGT